VTAERTYLDYNASAPLLVEARAAMVAALEACGNPSSVHAEGRHARGIVEAARDEVAALVNARPSEVVFTSGATEANNWVLAAGWAAIVVAGIEHDSVRAPAARSGARVAEIGAREDGTVAVETLAKALPAAGALTRPGVVALQLANNETGVMQPVAEVARLAHEHGLSVHTDAVQAAGRIGVDFEELGVDTMSLSSHKIGGPKGIGALVVGDRGALRPFITGGGQERRRRAGTENVAAIAGFGAAARAAARHLADMDRVASLRDQLEQEVVRVTPEAVVLGAKAHRVPNTSCIAWPGRRAETLVIKLDLAGVAVSAGAACSSGKVGESHVLAAMGLPPDVAQSAIRVSIGIGTTQEDIAAFLAVWQRMRGEAQIAA
jgi:cysteine desulfurase